MAIRIIDDAKLQNIAVAIQGKDNGGTMTVDQMPTRIAAISNSAPDPNGALLLLDWEGTLLQSYTRAEALALEALPNVVDTDCYSLVDHDLLTFQEWNWSLTDIKTWLQNHSQGKLIVGAIYTTTDGQNHDYWGSPRGNNATYITKQKRADTSLSANLFPNCRALFAISVPYETASVGSDCFYNCHSLRSFNVPSTVTIIDSTSFKGCGSLKNISIPNNVATIGASAFESCDSLINICIPDSVTAIGAKAFSGCKALPFITIPNGVASIENGTFDGCFSLPYIHIPSSVTTIGSKAFSYCYALDDVLLEGTPALSDTNAFASSPSTQRIYVPRANLSWFETATNWSALYSRFVAIEDYLDYLESIGADVSAYRTGE